METFWAKARARAEAADAADPLAALRDRFHLPQGLIYLDGNSLGPAPKAALEAIECTARQEWAEGLIRSWNTEGWFDLPLALGDRLAPLIGAGQGEVAVCDTVSVNIYKTLSAALALRPGRRVVIAEGAGFHTDRYVAEGLAAARPGTLLKLEGRDGSLADLIGPETAVVLANHVDYRTGAIRDMEAITAKAHAAGALVVWDLCHSAGILPVQLNDSGADMAVGCTYKYLNGGPGAPGFLFCAARHLDAVAQPLSGWWGHAAPFAFEEGYRPAPGIARFLCGTQPILSLRPVVAALDVFEGLDLAALHAKAQALTGLFSELVEESCAGFGVGLASPRDPAARGGQVTLTHPQGYAIVQALIAEGVIGDFRAPDILRFGFAPLYIRFAEVAEAARRLHAILAGERWRAPEFQARQKVT